MLIQSFILGFFLQYRQIEAERLNFIDVKEKTSRKYSKLFKILEKEKSDLQFKLDSEQKGIHARRDSEVRKYIQPHCLLAVVVDHEENSL